MKTSFKIIFISIIIFHTYFAQGSWTKMGDMPEVRFSHTVEVLNGKIYVIGGINNEGNSLPKTMLVYDELSKEWTQIPMMNNAGRWGHASCVVGAKLYVLGGNSTSGTTDKKIWMFDPFTKQWELKNEMSIMRALYDCAVIEDKIYVMGGTYEISGIYYIIGSNKVEVYDTKNDTWTQLADMPTIRWGHSITAVNNKIYVFGGVTFGNNNCVYKSVEVYDIRTNTWITKSNMPTARYCLTTCLVKNVVFAIGGWLHSDSGPLYDKVEVYNPDNNEWRTEVSLPVKRALLASVAIRDTIYVYGGARTTHPNHGTSEIHKFSFYDIFPQQFFIDKNYARVGVDSVLFRTKFSNKYNHQFTPFLVYKNWNETKKDSLLLFDDGFHGDSLLNDGIYGRYIPPQTDEDFYSLDISTIDNSNSKYCCTEKVCKFATAGPIVWKEYLIEQHSDSLYSMKVTLENQGSSFTVKNISAGLSTNDSIITEILSGGYNPQFYPDIEPGQSVYDRGKYGYVFHTKNNPETVKFILDICSDNISYWTDTIKVNLVTNIEDKSLFIPKEFSLKQNYPNPFNPNTTIKYSVPSEVKSEKAKLKSGKENGFIAGAMPAGRQGVERDNIQLKVYDILGREVATLVNKKQKPGNYEIEFNGSKLPSGVYLYRLTANNFFETKKMILLK